MANRLDDRLDEHDRLLNHLLILLRIRAILLAVPSIALLAPDTVITLVVASICIKLDVFLLLLRAILVVVPSITLLAPDTVLTLVVASLYIMRLLIRTILL